MGTKWLDVFGFQANLLRKDETTFYWPFQVSAKTRSEAKQILEKYLSEPGRGGLCYISCVGMRDDGTQVVLASDD